MSETIEVRVPDIGDYGQVPVIEILADAGDTVRQEQSLITLESDKATMETPSPADGLLQSIDVALGDEVSEGTLIATIKVKGSELTEAGQSGDKEASEENPPLQPGPAQTREETRLAGSAGRAICTIGGCLPERRVYPVQGLASHRPDHRRSGRDG
jgi:pyruvate/2-oxoglutarate dehydrogenase complex dihydrolipoamide acyltransferase (E2) component